MTEPIERPFHGIRLIDLTLELGAYATRLFADLGAEVIRVEPPGGRADRRAGPSLDPARPEAGGAAFAFLAAGKTSIVLDDTIEDGRAALRDLVSTAQVVVYDADERRGWMVPLLNAVPGDRVVTVLSWFGLTGPYADYAGCDLVAQALGGIAYLSGTDEGPPLRIGGGQSAIVASIYAAVATAAALADVERQGGQHLLDLSAQEAFAHSLQNAPQVYDLEHAVPRRGPAAAPLMQGIVTCRDGAVLIAGPPFMADQWNNLVRWMADEGHPGGTRLRDPEWTAPGAQANGELRAEFRDIIADFLGHRPRAAVLGEAMRRKILIAPVNAMADLPHDPQLVHRRFFRSVTHPALGRDLVFPGPPYRLSEPVWQTAAAPSLADVSVAAEEA
jgi:benzylsuccinate CoA-transferase BbsE subunit